jgi:hypothetical protein
LSAHGIWWVRCRIEVRAKRPDAPSISLDAISVIPICKYVNLQNAKTNVLTKPLEVQHTMRRSSISISLALLLGGIAAAQNIESQAAQPDFTAMKDDFIPGEKTLLYDDFTDMAPDEAPPHWKVRGAALTLMQAGTERQITATQKTTLTPMLDRFPQNFSIESEVLLQKEGRQGWYFFPAASEDRVLEVWTEDRDEGKLRV